MQKRVLFLSVLFLMLALALTSCGSSDVPEGMQLVSDPDIDGFLLYVPEGYLADRTTGIPMAAVSALDQTSISGYLTTPEEADVPAYFAAHRSELESLGEEFLLETEASAVTVADRNAYAYIYSFRRDSVGYRVMQIYIPVGETLSEGLCILTYTGQTDATVTGTVGYSDHMEDFEKVIQVFAFPDSRTTPATEEPLTEGAPDGMQLSSVPDITNYALYIPLDWTVDMKTGISSAYDPTDKVSLNVTSCYPEGYETIGEYVATLAEKYEGFYEDFEQIGEYTTLTVSDFPAYRYEYTGVRDGTVFRFCQIFIYRHSGFHKGLYAMTFSAPGATGEAAEAAYTAHADDLDAVLSAFLFK